MMMKNKMYFSKLDWKNPSQMELKLQRKTFVWLQFQNQMKLIKRRPTRKSLSNFTLISKISHGQVNLKQLYNLVHKLMMKKVVQ